ncbi:protein Dok-7 isoform X4 [Pteropus vampyrus]|uniref:Protein Dok-7 isoform X4 n=1 Tax=Pteropus vampyrus TaxID=132908 RepID=A0A6P6BK31_PTEVA|nr:protein Dok-7 isoform X4 [Pteropus vampyrus]
MGQGHTVGGGGVQPHLGWAPGEWLPALRWGSRLSNHDVELEDRPGSPRLGHVPCRRGRDGACVGSAVGPEAQWPSPLPRAGGRSHLGNTETQEGRWACVWQEGQALCSPADCLLMLAYKDKSERAKGLRERSSLMLEDICGLDLGLPYEGLAHTLAIVCLSQAVMLGFDSREAMCAWDTRIRYALGEVHRFHVTVAPGTKLESGPATLHLCNDVLVVARDVPPAVTGQWKLSDLRRYGAVPNGFIFEGGTRCGYFGGLIVLWPLPADCELGTTCLAPCGSWGRSLLPVLGRGGADQLPVRLHRPGPLPDQGPLRAAAGPPRPRPRGPRGGARGPGGPGSPTAGEAAQPPLPLRPAGQWRGRPQPVQLVVRGQPLGRQCQQPAHRVAGAVLVLGQHIAGGAGTGGGPGPRRGRVGRLAAAQASAAAAAAGGGPPGLLGQRHRHRQPLLLLWQLLVLRRQQPGRVACRRRVWLAAQPAAGSWGARAQPLCLPPGDSRVPGAQCPAAPLRHAPQPAPGTQGPDAGRAGRP